MINNTMTTHLSLERKKSEKPKIYTDSDIDKMLADLPLPELNDNYEKMTTQNTLKVYQLVARGYDNNSIASLLGCHPTTVMKYRSIIAKTFGNIKQMLGSQALYAQIQTTKAWILRDIHNLEDISRDSTIDTTSRLEATKASISTKMLLLRVDFDGMKAILELEDIAKQNKDLIETKKGKGNDILKNKKYKILPATGITFIDSKNDNEDSFEDGQTQEGQSGTDRPQFDADIEQSSKGAESIESIDERFTTESETAFSESGEDENNRNIEIGSDSHNELLSEDSNFQV